MEKGAIYKQESDGSKEILAMTSKLKKASKLSSRNGHIKVTLLMDFVMRKDSMSKKED